jgi:hypothetical protein
MAIGRYPRMGDRIAPMALREILGLRAPAPLVEGFPGRKVLLRDLDERVWDYLTREQIDALAEIIVEHVRNKDCNRVIHLRHLPRAPAGMTLADLSLENRTYNCLVRERFLKEPQKFIGATLGDMLGIRSFGARCLVDILTAMETFIARHGVLDEQLTAEARKLANVPHAMRIHRDDPRLGALLQSVDGEARGVKQVVEMIYSRRLDPPDAFRICEDIVTLRQQAERYCDRSLEEEIVDVFMPRANPRNREIVAAYYGWDGGDGGTLKVLGSRYGLTRERIRQVCAKAVGEKKGIKFFSPVISMAKDLIVERMPERAEVLREELVREGYLRNGMQLEGFEKAAGFLFEKPPFVIVKLADVRLVVASHEADLPRAIVETARRLVFNYGMCNVATIREELAEQFPAGVTAAMITQALGTQDSLRWLDRSGGWFHLTGQGVHGLPRLLEKYLSVTGPIPLSQVVIAVARHRKLRRLDPSRTILREYCDQMPGVRVEGNMVIPEPVRDWHTTLRGIELLLVGLLKEHGPVLERGRFEDICIEAGINRSSFNVYLMHSPIIAQYGRSVYGLPGERVTSSRARTIAAEANVDSDPRVLEGYGWLDEDRAWLGYRVSRGTIGSGVITVPAGLKGKIHGTYKLFSTDGESVGTLVMKKDSGWGMSPFIRRRNGQRGDYLLITLNIRDRTAEIEIGDYSVFDDVPLDAGPVTAET